MILRQSYTHIFLSLQRECTTKIIRIFATRSRRRGSSPKLNRSFEKPCWGVKRNWANGTRTPWHWSTILQARMVLDLVGGRWLVSWLEGDHMIGREHVKQWSHSFFCNAHGLILEFNQVQALVETLKPLQRQVSFMSKANSTRPPLCSRERWRAAKLSWGRTIRTPWRRWTTWRSCWRWDHGRMVGAWDGEWQPWNDLKPWIFQNSPP